MSLTLSQIRAGILRSTGTLLTDWDNGNTDLDLYANRAWWSIMEEFDFREKEATITFNTVAGTAPYATSTIAAPIIFDALQSLAIKDVTSLDWSPLELMSVQEYETWLSDDTTTEAKPTHYLRRADKIILWPTPDQVYSIKLYYLAVLSDIPSGGPEIPQAWHEIIQFGANWRAFADLGEVDKVTLFKNLEADSINNRTPVKAKELADTRYSHVEVPGRDYP